MNFETNSNITFDKKCFKIYTFSGGMNMFFETADFSVDSVSVFKFQWGAKVSSSDTRPYHALSYRIKGNAKFIHENDVVSVKTGDIVFVPAFYNYTLDSGDESVCVIHFKSSERLPERIKKFTPEATDYYEKRFNELYNIYTKKQIGFEHEIRSIFYKIIMHIERDIVNNKTSGSDLKISHAIDYIHENFTDANLTVARLAKDCNMSETYFRKLFFKNCGTAPLEYINNLRLKYAIELLNSNYYTVNEVAEKCGFSSSYYFSAFVKKETGLPPSKFIN